jgi:hypothetical protein
VACCVCGGGVKGVDPDTVIKADCTDYELEEGTEWHDAGKFENVYVYTCAWYTDSPLARCGAYGNGYGFPEGIGWYASTRSMTAPEHAHHHTHADTHANKKNNTRTHANIRKHNRTAEVACCSCGGGYSGATQPALPTCTNYVVSPSYHHTMMLRLCLYHHTITPSYHQLLFCLEREREGEGERDVRPKNKK